MNSICCFGEILWDLLPTGKLAGGAPMNVATHLQNLGIDAKMISCVGNDDLGQELKDFLASKNCTTQYIESNGNFPTGIVNVTLSEKLDASYEIVEPVAWDFISLSDEILHGVENAQALVFGTLASRGSYSFNTLLHLLEKAKLKVFDVNLRQPHFTQKLIETLLQQADIVKMNDDELNIIGGWYFSEDSEIEKLQKLAKKFDLNTLIVTQGGAGAMLLQHGKYHKSKGFEVKVVDTIGSGDSFLAGFLKNYLAENDPAYTLNYACALGALVATQSGANPEIKEQEIIDLMNTFS